MHLDADDDYVLLFVCGAFYGWSTKTEEGFAWV